VNSGETVAIGWIDNGNVHGSFMLSVIEILMRSQNTDNKVTTVFRTPGLYLGINRDRVIESWENSPTDWLLWIDSDMAPNFENFIMLKEKADKDLYPVISGLYFAADFNNTNRTFPTTRPVLDANQPIDLDIDEPQPVNWSGLGFTLIHMDVIKSIKEKFGESVGIHQQDITSPMTPAEDVNFFEKIKKCNIQGFVYPKVVIPHIKYVPIDLDYHNMVSKLN
jgi:hypothetical protein